MVFCNLVVEWKCPLHQSFTDRPVSKNREPQERRFQRRFLPDFWIPLVIFLNKHVLSRLYKAGECECEPHKGRRDGTQLVIGAEQGYHNPSTWKEEA